jgi:hypothetical protein
MYKSPAIKTDGPGLETPDGREVLDYVAALFKGTLPVWPGAYLIVTGRKTYLEVSKRGLTDRGVPWHKILTVLDWEGPSTNPEARVVKYEIEYRPLRKVTAVFTPESGGSPVEVHYEITPDGTVVEAGGQLTLLKDFLWNKSGQVVKVAVKLKGLAELDFATQNTVKTVLKGKITGVYDVTVTKGISVELYLDTFVKHATAKDPDEPNKPQTKFGAEVGGSVKFYW